MILRNEAYNELLNDAQTISNTLVSTGSPPNWTSTDVNLIGLSKHQTSNFLDPEKYYQFNKTDYQESKSIIGIRSHYLAVIKDETNCIVQVKDVSWIGSPDVSAYTNNTMSCNYGKKIMINFSSFEADHIIKTDRLFVHNKTIVRLEVFVWR
jgi:hypothetical protein